MSTAIIVQFLCTIFAMSSIWMLLSVKCLRAKPKHSNRTCITFQSKNKGDDSSTLFMFRLNQDKLDGQPDVLIKIQNTKFKIQNILYFVFCILDVSYFKISRFWQYITLFCVEIMLVAIELTLVRGSRLSETFFFRRTFVQTTRFLVIKILKFYWKFSDQLGKNACFLIQNTLNICIEVIYTHLLKQAAHIIDFL